MHSNIKPCRKILLGEAYRNRFLPYHYRSLDQCWMLASNSAAASPLSVALRLIQLFVGCAATVNQMLRTDCPKPRCNAVDRRGIVTKIDKIVRNALIVHPFTCLADAIAIWNSI